MAAPARRFITVIFFPPSVPDAGFAAPAVDLHPEATRIATARSAALTGLAMLLKWRASIPVLSCLSGFPLGFAIQKKP
jgi:hypothetical protein